jgi:hypothetical protein
MSNIVLLQYSCVFSACKWAHPFQVHHMVWPADPSLCHLSDMWCRPLSMKLLVIEKLYILLSYCMCVKFQLIPSLREVGHFHTSYSNDRIKWRKILIMDFSPSSSSHFHSHRLGPNILLDILISNAIHFCPKILHPCWYGNRIRYGFVYNGNKFISEKFSDRLKRMHHSEGNRCACYYNKVYPSSDWQMLDIELKYKPLRLSVTRHCTVLLIMNKVKKLCNPWSVQASALSPKWHCPWTIFLVHI